MECVPGLAIHDFGVKQTLHHVLLYMLETHVLYNHSVDLKTKI